MRRVLVCTGYNEHMIVGIDEVGRGAWAGPLVVGAVLLGTADISGLTDSKKLTKKQRELLDVEIRQKAQGIGLGWVSAKEIDRIGLSRALKLASRRAMAHIRREYEEVIIDGTVAFLDDPRVTLMKKADLLVPSVSAASIVAKVARDKYMRHVDGVFPGYKFTGNVGYGTAAHRAAIEELGVTPLHRLSFAPLRQFAGSDGRSLGSVHFENGFAPGLAGALAPGQSRAADVFENEGDRKTSTAQTTKQIGDAAENEVAEYLKKRGHEILARNWRTKFCEIDIVSHLGDTVYFTEVKYRKNDRQGGGMAAITVKKQRQMAFAAEYFAVKNKLGNTNLRLVAADVSGQPPQVKGILKLG